MVATPDIAGFSGRLADARRARAKERRKDLSQAAVGRAFNVSRSNVNAWEQGTHFPPVEVMQGLADYLGVSRLWLLLGVGEMELKPQSEMADSETVELLNVRAKKRLPARRTRSANARGSRTKGRGKQGG